MLCDSFDEWVDVTTLLCHFRTPPQGGLGIVTNSGAFRGMAFDLCDELGVAVAGLSPATLADAAQRAAGVRARWQSARRHGADRVPARSPRQGVTPLIDDPRSAASSSRWSAAPARFRWRTARHASVPPIVASGKPTIYAIFAAGSTLPPELEPMLRAANIPFPRSPEAAVRAMARCYRYGDGAGGGGAARARDAERAAAAGARHARRISGQGVARGRWLRDAGGCAWPRISPRRGAIAARIGYPVALKAQAGRAHP